MNWNLSFRKKEWRSHPQPSEKTILITAPAVLLEIGNALCHRQFRQSAILLLDALERDPNVGIVSLTDTLYQQGLQLFQERLLDKGWGLVDCVSFVVMSERKIQDARTADNHFRQAGFRPMLQG
jgi:hypothetical protein